MYGRYCALFLGLVGCALAAMAGVNLFIDPYGLKDHNTLAPDRAALAEHKNDRLFRLIGFKFQPRSIVLLGDSRTKNLSEDYFAQQGVEVRNLGYNAGTLREAIQTFWFAVKYAHLNCVIIGVPFNTWSDADGSNLVQSAESFIDHPAMYYLNAEILATSIDSVVRKVRGDTSINSAPPMSRDSFWSYQLEYTAPSYYQRWRPPNRLRGKLQELVRYCAAHGIKVVFLIPPTHVDLQARIPMYGLQLSHRDYLATLRSMGQVLDYDVDCAMTRNASNFLDPFHTAPEVNRLLVADIVRRVGLVAVNYRASQ